jgi:GMP synthase (glutamine-hydrolysing)
MATPRETVAIIDYGAQYIQLIARRFRELQVYSEIFPPKVAPKTLLERGVRGIVLSGGPESVYGRNAPSSDPALFSLGVPILGICYGMQLMGHLLGGKVKPSGSREFGHALLELKDGSRLLSGLSSPLRIWMSHGDSIEKLPPGFILTGSTANTPVAAMEDPERRLFAIQFHPEVNHTDKGREILSRFADFCGFSRNWTASSFVESASERIRETVGEGRVICALSGGVDSAVTALLVQRVVGDRLACVFVDNGLLRKDEANQVRKRFEEKLRMRVIFKDASRRFLSKLKGVKDPERKRKIIGREFINVFEETTKKLGRADFLAQGTVYPDVIESSSSLKGRVIKSHHNVGGLPKRLRFRLVEPLRELFKDEVRRVGLELGLDEEFVHRQPFPGPGLAVRCLGEVRKDRLDLLREADAIFVDEIRSAGLYRKMWQSFAVLLPVNSVGVMGDGRTYESVVALRAVESQDGMTADWAHLPHPLLARVSSRIVNEVRGINRVVFDVSSKPPSTIEWE